MRSVSVVGSRLREARERLGISQKQLGIKAGLDPSVASPRINQYETGKHVPDIQTAQRLAEVLRVPAPLLVRRRRPARGVDFGLFTRDSSRTKKDHANGD